MHSKSDKIFDAIIWLEIPMLNNTIVKVADLQPHYFQKALDFLQDNYINNDVLCRISRINNSTSSVSAFLNQAHFLLKDATSLIALDKNDEIAAVMVLKVMQKSEQIFHRVKIPQDNVEFKDYCEIQHFLCRQIPSFGPHERYLQIFHLAVAPNYRQNGLGVKLLSSVDNVAKSLKIDKIIGLFNCKSLQEIASELSFTKLHEINYVSEWLDKNGKMIFGNPGPGNFTIALMMKNI